MIFILRKSLISLFSNPETMRNIQNLSTLILCIAGLMFTTNFAYTQGDISNRGLEVIVDESSNAYFNVSFEKGMTLYSICKKYQVATIDVMMLNDIVNPEQISIGTNLILPLNKEHFRVSNKYTEGYIPVYYKIKKSETLFRISKVYFSQDVKDMIERNELSGFTLAIDQKLLVGYYKLNGTSHPVREEEKVLVQKELVKQTQITSAEIVDNDVPVKVKEIVSTRIEKSTPTEIQQYQKENVLADESRITSSGTNTKLEKTQTPITTIETTTPTESNISTAPITSTKHTTEQVIVNLEEKEQVDPLTPVATYRFRPNLRAKFKKVIKSDRLDHSLADKKPSLDLDEAEVDSTATIVEEKPESNLVSKSLKGIAYWDKKGKDYENLMVLHKTAEVNTLIKLTNPINGMSTFARVVGRIPDNAFKKDIDVVMSPAVAKKIGAIDSRMQISMTYQINKP